MAKSKKSKTFIKIIYFDEGSATDLLYILAVYPTAKPLSLFASGDWRNCEIFAICSAACA